MKKALLGLSFLVLVGCGSPDDLNYEPIVASFNDSSTGIQLLPNIQLASAQKRAEVFAMADAKASEICRNGPNRRAQYASTRILPNGYVERLYLCLR